ncbi:hypothetical protein AB0N19_00075 [Streptomyces sp. NPDC051132]|uniref:hypothetical protein n=1 Tax=Streptomyces sp. NPDC051132 TaxID=3155667 RepID=UPI00341CF841
MSSILLILRNGLTCSWCPRRVRPMRRHRPIAMIATPDHAIDQEWNPWQHFAPPHTRGEASGPDIN